MSKFRTYVPGGACTLRQLRVFLGIGHYRLMSLVERALGAAPEQTPTHYADDRVRRTERRFRRKLTAAEAKRVIELFYQDAAREG